METKTGRGQVVVELLSLIIVIGIMGLGFALIAKTVTEEFNKNRFINWSFENEGRKSEDFEKSMERIERSTR